MCGRRRRPASLTTRRRRRQCADISDDTQTSQTTGSHCRQDEAVTDDGDALQVASAGGHECIVHLPASQTTRGRLRQCAAAADDLLLR